MAAPVLQIVQVSDLHLIEPASLQSCLQYLSTLPAALLPGQMLQREDYNVSAALRSEVEGLCGNLPSAVALTGDISTWPGDPPAVINRHQSSVVAGLPRPLFAILGNHDWGPLRHVTSYLMSNLQTQFDITAPRCELFSVGAVNVIVFMVDSNIRMFPCQGNVDRFTRRWLSNEFQAGRNGKLSNLTAAQYAGALKILLLHHVPLERADYAGGLSAIEYWILQLRDRSGWLAFCKDDVDIMLFGHTHVPLAVARNGFVMVNCGTTTGLNDVNNIQRMTVYDDLSVDVQQFNWNGLRFVAGQQSTRYRRGAAPSSVIGAGRWA